MALDLGRKRCGIAVTDTLHIVATGLATVPSAQLVSFLQQYFSREDVEMLVIGNPVNLKGEPSDSWQYIKPLLSRITKTFPTLPHILYDERFTSTIAHRAMIDSGMTKTQRRDKEAVDVMAATILLNDYLESKKHKTT